MNVNLHCERKFHSLGMVRIEGKMTSERAVELVEERLNEFSLNMETDIVATVTDGANVMKKIGRITPPKHFTCIAHAVHLSVCDVLYKKG